MTDRNRWDEDRYDNGQRQQDYRSGGGYGEPRYGDRSYGARSYEDRDYQGRNERFGQPYDGGGRNEGRSFDEGYDPYAASGFGGYGEEGYRSRNYGRDRDEDNRRYSNRQAADFMLHQGYRAPFGQGDRDRNLYQRDTGASRYGRSDDGGSGYSAYGSAGRSYERNDNRDNRGFWDQTKDEVSSWFGDEEAARRRRMDETRGGEHRGRGPKNYTRSDDRIREDLNDRLTDDYLLDASDIDVEVSGGEITLTGHVASRRDKRRAEDIAEDVAGVKHVQNNLRVKESATGSTTGAATAGGSGTTTTGDVGASALGATSGQASANARSN